MNADVKSFLCDLKEVNDTNTVSINVPSLGKKASFTHFNVNQQKQLLRAAFEGVEGTIKQSSILNSIVQDNCSTDAELLITDRTAVMVEMRKAVVGDTVTIDKEEYSLDTLGEYDSSKLNLTGEVESSGITATLKVPTLANDTAANTKMIAEISKLTDEKKQTQSVELVLIYEITKYIDKVTLGDNSVDFSELSIYERKAVVTELPLSLNNQIIKFISDTKDVETSNTTFEEGVTLTIDAGFLNAE
jgi:hypothetical protein